MNQKYNSGRGFTDWVASDVRTLLVNSTYVMDPDHANVSDIPASAIAIRGPLLTNKTVVDGFVRSLATRYEDLALLMEIKGIVFYVDTGVDGTSTLLAYADEEPAFPFTPAGFHYDFAYDAGMGGFWRVV